MSTGYAHARGAAGGQWGTVYGSRDTAPGQMRLGIDFPYVCERCLGPNPFVQMIKVEFGAACRITERPFHLFKWINPQTSRKMRTNISYDAAALKNCCQSCMADMTYGVPLVVRDALLRAAGKTVQDMPESAAGQAYFFAQRDRQGVLQSQGAVGIGPSAATTDDAVEQAAGKLFGGQRRRGDAVNSESSTLWLGAMPGHRLPSDQSVRQYFSSSGGVVSVRLLNQKGFGFVEFESHSAADRALQRVGTAIGVEIGGTVLKVAWAKGRGNKRGSSQDSAPGFSTPGARERGKRAGETVSVEADRTLPPPPKRSYGDASMQLQMIPPTFFSPVLRSGLAPRPPLHSLYPLMHVADAKRAYQHLGGPILHTHSES